MFLRRAGSIDVRMDTVATILRTPRAANETQRRTLGSSLAAAVTILTLGWRMPM